MFSFHDSLPRVNRKMLMLYCVLKYNSGSGYRTPMRTSVKAIVLKKGKVDKILAGQLATFNQNLTIL